VTDIKWEPICITLTPKEAITEYNKDVGKALFQDTSIKNYCDMNRICEVEDAIVEWYEEEFYQKLQFKVDLAFLLPLFKIQSVQYGGVDGSILRVTASARCSGTLDKEHLGLALVVKSGLKQTDFLEEDTEDPVSLCNEVKRLGFLVDRKSPLQVRIGDSVLIYISKSAT